MPIKSLETPLVISKQTLKLARFLVNEYGLFNFDSTFFNTIVTKTLNSSTQIKFVVAA